MVGSNARDDGCCSSGICVYDLFVFFSFHNFISKCPALSLAFQVQCLSTFGSHLIGKPFSLHQEAMFFLFQIVLVGLSGFFPPHSIFQDPPFSLCMMQLKSGWTKIIQD